MIHSKHRPIALVSLCLGQLMCVLDISIVNIAIPSIQRDLGLTTSSLQWLVTAYVLTYGGFLLVGGRLGDLVGRRRMLLLGLVCFVLSSALGGMATNGAALLAGRAGQGLGGAIITPTVMSFIAGLYPEGAARNRALSLLGAVTGAGFALGLILGGLLTSTVGWRWVFFVNLPIGMLVAGAIIWLLPETEREGRPVNLRGAILATAGLALVAYTLSSTDQRFWSIRTLSLFAATGLLFYLFIRTERTSSNPLIPAGLLRHRSLARALIGSTTFGAITGPTTFLLTLYLQNIGRLDPLRTGLAFLPQEVTVFLAASLAGRYVTRFGTRSVLAAGIGLFAVGSMGLTQMTPAGQHVAAIMPGLLFIGLGIGSVNVAGSIAATEGIPRLQHGVSAGIWNTGTQIGTALGVASLTAVASSRTMALLSAHPNMSDTVATVSGYQLAFVVGIGFSLAGLAALFAVRRWMPREKAAD